MVLPLTFEKYQSVKLTLLDQKRMDAATILHVELLLIAVYMLATYCAHAAYYAYLTALHSSCKHRFVTLKYCYVKD